MIGTEYNRREAVKILLVKGADRELQNNLGRKAIDIAQENEKDELVKILFNDFGFLERVKIKCNKKIVYEPEKPSYSFAILFFLLFHLFFLPVNILSEFHFTKKYIKLIPLGFEVVY